MLQWRRGEITSPLLIAIAQGDFDNVTYMLKNTRHLMDAPNDQALCVAARFGWRDIARFLMLRGTPALPQNGCIGGKPEDLAAEHGFKILANELRQYRLETQ